MSSVLKIVYFSSLTIVLIGLINPIGAKFKTVDTSNTSTDRLIVAEFTPDPSRPPVVTQGSGTR